MVQQNRQRRLEKIDLHRQELEDLVHRNEMVCLELDKALWERDDKKVGVGDVDKRG